jgi:flavin-dependent dehydrogenase
MAGSPDGTWDVVIAGASFAGLAAARALAGPSAGDPPAPAGASAPAWPSAAAGRPGGAQRAPRVLLLDARPIGEGVTSACAAPVRVVRLMGAEAAIAQVHDELVVHTPDGAVRWPLPEPFCTFDYRTFCRQAAQGCEATFRLARVRGRQGRRVLTSAGAIEARFMVDATGPAPALAGRGPPPDVAFGIESEVPAAVEAGLHFHFLPDLRDGYAWAFPAGDRTRFGVLSYRGRTKLLPVLRGFMARFGLAPGDLHGGYLATGWTAGVADGVFVAGDAAGHCLPLSGEGIRTAVLAGLRCGTLLRQVLDGRLAEARAQDAYRAYLAAARRRYRALLLGNLLLLGLPRRALGPAVRWLARPSVQRWFFAHYMRILDGARPVGRAPARA